MKLAAILAVVAALSPFAAAQLPKFGEGAPMATPSYNGGAPYMAVAKPPFMDTLFTCVEEYQATCYGYDLAEEVLEVDGQERRLEGGLLTSQSQEGLVAVADEDSQRGTPEHEGRPNGERLEHPENQPDGERPERPHGPPPHAGANDERLEHPENRPDGERPERPHGPPPHAGVNGERLEHPESHPDGERPERPHGPPPRAGVNGERAPRGQHPGRPDRAESRGGERPEKYPDGERPEHPQGDKRASRGDRRRATNGEVARKFSDCPAGNFEHIMESLSPECGAMLYKLAAFDSMLSMGEELGARGQNRHRGNKPMDGHDDNVHHWKNFFKGGDDDDDRGHPRYYDEDSDDFDDHHFPRILILGAAVVVGVFGYRWYNNRDRPVGNYQPQGPTMYVGNGQPQIATGAPMFFQATAPAAQPGSSVSPV